jgi:hypothetical protein
MTIIYKIKKHETNKLERNKAVVYIIDVGIVVMALTRHEFQKF